MNSGKGLKTQRTEEALENKKSCSPYYFYKKKLQYKSFFDTREQSELIDFVLVKESEQKLSF